MPVFYGAIDLAQNELRNARVQNIPTAPSTPVTGQLWYDSTNQILKWWNGSTWVPAQGAGALTPASTVTTETIGTTAIVGTSVNYAREDHRHAMNVAAVAALDMGGFAINNLASPSNPNDAASKIYVDNAIAGLAWKQPVRVATTAPGILTSIGSIIDGVNMNAGDRVLVKAQTTQSENGIYTWAANALTRATDMDAANEFVNAAVYVAEGTVGADTAWVQTSNAPITVGTTNIVWVQFAGGGAVTAGAGMTQTGNTLNVIAGDTSLTVAADSVIVNTAVIATVASLAAYGKKYAGALTGTASPETVTHNLNTRDVQVTVLNGATPYTAVEVDWDATTVNTVTIRYNPNLGAGYRVVVMG